MKNIKILEGEDYAQLYRDVLIDTPVGPYSLLKNIFYKFFKLYFMQFLEESLASG